MELAEQTALITGGTAGIGLACAELLAREGASVISTGRDEQRGKSAAAGIDGRVRFVQADLSDIESVESLIRTWAAEFGARGVRVNSVAPGPAKTEGVEAEWGEGNEELGRALPLGRTAEPEEITHAVLFLASPGQASSPVQPCTPMAAAAPSETHEEERPMSKKYDAQWENALTVVQEVSPLFIPEGAQAMTVVIDYPPGSTGIRVALLLATCWRGRCCSSWKARHRA